jgi:heptosyltransferase III
MAKQKRILIVRPDRIGDVVLSTPIPREIKNNFPDSFVAVLVRKYTQDIYANNPNVDKIILIDDLPDDSYKSFFKKVSEIRKYKFTHSLTLLPTERLNYFLFFAGIPYRVGVGHKFYQFLTLTHYVSRNKYIPLRHEADYCMDIARKIGVKSDNLSTEIFLSEDEKREVEITRNNFISGKKYLFGIHTTSGNSAPNWTTKKYRDLILELIKEKNIQVVVTDNNVPEEISNIANVLYPNVGLSLRKSFINFSALDLLISASTGPMHIAAALKTKTLSMFCPMTACSPKLWGPMGNESKIILPEEKYCQTVCPGDPKKCTFEGDGGITIERIISSLKEILN